MNQIIFWIFVAVIGTILVRYIVGIYNNIIFLKNNCEKAFANIDVLLKKQADLMPQLTIVAEGAMTHEKRLISELLQSRQHYLSTEQLDVKVDSANQFRSHLKSIFLLAEKYPKLISQQALLALQTSAKGLEDQIADRREFFNQTVTLYNTNIRLFPNLIFTLLFRFKDIPLLYVQQESAS
ncbi:LemA family protein [Providencia alcalifaciens]|uniref:LemA protein n=1 Tax=Providencia alcalifaciens TaxID=126385 RepID=A0A4R3NJY2_9GAMM|nr:LemA family protein [Providencia alcalifaciens]TCT35062.1 LemA protein [Providencia alcalifaciens]